MPIPRMKDLDLTHAVTRITRQEHHQLRKEAYRAEMTLQQYLRLRLGLSERPGEPRTSA